MQNQRTRQHEKCLCFEADNNERLVIQTEQCRSVHTQAVDWFEMARTRGFVISHCDTRLPGVDWPGLKPKVRHVGVDGLRRTTRGNQVIMTHLH